MSLVIITRKHTYVIECKNLFGNIEIDSTGAFVRNYQISGKKIKEGIYSPITQNQRHLQVLKEIKRADTNNIINKILFDKNFDEIYKTVVVLANPKTCLNAKDAKEEIKSQVIRADALISYLKEMDAKSSGYARNNEQMLREAQFLLEKNKEERSDYAKRYEEMVNDLTSVKSNIVQMKEDERKEDERKEDERKEPAQKQINKEKVIAKLKEFRLETSRRENIKPYFIFNNVQMEELVEKFPENKDDLIKISGFGSVKVSKYGEDILNILHGEY